VLDADSRWYDTVRMDNKDKQLGVRMPSETVETLAKIGKKLDRPIAWVIRAAVDEYIERHKPSK
jgi:predicted DNA-binding protein